MRSESPDGSYTGLAVDLPSSQTEYKDESSLVRDRKYYYQIIAVNEEGESDPGEPVYGISLQDIPPAPEGLTASDGTYGNKVELKWNASVNAVTYTVYRARDENGSAEKYEKIAGNITALLLEDVTALPDVTYHYVVTALSSGGESEPGTGATGKITTGAPIQTSAPINVTASDGNYDTITVAWSAVDGASGYSVYRCDTINGTYTLITASIKTTLLHLQIHPRPMLFAITTRLQHGAPELIQLKAIKVYLMTGMPCRSSDVPAGLTAHQTVLTHQLLFMAASERTGFIQTVQG
jgi:fibronectin type 3 domain-containing protein